MGTDKTNKKMIISIPKFVHKELKRIAVVNETTMTGIIMAKIAEVIEEEMERTSIAENRNA